MLTTVVGLHGHALYASCIRKPCMAECVQPEDLHCEPPGPLSADDELVKCVRSRYLDNEAMQILVSRFDRLVFFVAAGADDRLTTEDVEEVVSEVFTQFWLTRCYRYDPARARLSAYLAGMARNMAISKGRAIERKRCLQLDEPLGMDTMADVDPSPLELLVRNHDDSRVQEAISKLPERERVVVSLRYLLELPHAEIAEVLGTSNGNSRVICSRAIDHLQEILGAGLEGKT